MANDYQRSARKQSGSGGTWVRLLQTLAKNRSARQRDCGTESSEPGVSEESIEQGSDEDVTTETKRVKEELLRRYVAPDHAEVKAAVIRFINGRIVAE